jgi:hypothetical protein
MLSANGVLITHGVIGSISFFRSGSRQGHRGFPRAVGAGWVLRDVLAP